MQYFFRITTVLIVLTVGTSTFAQPPGPPAGGARRELPDPAQLATTAVSRLMKFDTDNDGRLTKQELSDSRLEALFLQADTNRDGILSKEEIHTWATKEAATVASSGRGRPGANGPGGPGSRGPFPGSPFPGGPPTPNGLPPRRPG